MNVKNFFATPFKKRLEAYLSKLSWADASCSDPMTYLNTYHLWKHKSLQGWFKRSGGVSEEDWTARRFVQVKSLREVQRLEQEIMQRLRGLGIGDDEGGHSFTSIPGTTEESRPLLLKIALAGAAYPNYFLQGTCEEKDAVRVLGGRDPFSSVYLSKWPVNQPGPLYMNTIKKYFEECGSQITVSFDGSAKVYVKFGSSASAHDENKKAVIMPGRVTLPVYRALKLRHMQIPIKVPILPPDVANERAKKVFGDVINKSLVCWSNGQVNQRVKPRRSLLPGIQASVMTVLVTHIDDPSSFWVQIVDDAFMNKQNWITNKLNCEPLKPLRGSKDLSVGQLVVAPFNEQGSRVYHRARVVALKFDHESKVLVQYIDYGNTEPVPLSHLYDFNDELVNCGVRDEPALAIHCYLAEIQPSMNQSENATWSSSAISAFRKHFYSIKAIVSIYSVVNEIVAVHLFNEDTRIDEKGQVDRELSFNFFLIRNKLAEPVDEPFLSRENHISREAALKRSETSPAIDALTTDSDEYFADFDFSSPTESECHNRCITLQGPRSPLEVNLICLTKKCMGKEARIEGNSVNSVLLDNFPMDHHARLVVAQIVTQVNNSDRLTLRETTVMPQIHGLLGLVSMIFAPRVELRSDPERKYVTGALCGLGFDSETNASYFPENDMDIEFDTQFDLFDMINVNKIRYWINKSIGNEGLSTPTIGTAPVIATARSKIVSHLLDLLQKKRESLEPSRCEKPYRWNCINAQYHMPPYGNDPNAHEISESDYTMSTYPLIWGIELNEGSEMTRVNAMRRNLIRLDNLANGRERLSQPVKCELCQMFLENLQSLRFHLTTTVHRFNLMNFEKHFPKKSSKARK